MLLGLAAGDAVGTTVEFQVRGSFSPMTDMVGGGPFKLEKGQWTDDTSMALCLASSLIEKQGFDPADQMERYLRWRNVGYMSSTGSCFDIGMTVQNALNRYVATGDPYSGSTDLRSAGNGSIMRLAPIVIAFHRNREKLAYYAGESSKTTHGCEEAVESCKLFSLILEKAISTKDKDAILKNHNYSSASANVSAICSATYLSKTYDDLTGSGYVIESLESALWCFYHANSFREAILLATNLGNDADTTAAICGQVAGAYYGKSNLPSDWLASISMQHEISDLSKKLYKIFENE